ncbi:hypothetical protein I6F35_33570 [Bradyrhizobium sp. BRP22]|uniref:hypothetical protein n=1 Tax=Bradyrhizobium sp. BRP22 TaxID=2793821 RepID=UPI001CD2CD1A|nr:hypothetical protein [Bradyrhizobium sp. BRP22]MCA1458065.1 hypothetical protein [Bradyrhizobium sp. BRP22]
MSNARIVPCEACRTEGRILHFWGRDWHGNDLGWEEDCQHCEATGGEVIETQPITLDDLEEHPEGLPHD